MDLHSLRISTWAPLAMISLLMAGCPGEEELTQCETNAECRDDEDCLNGLCEPVECDPSCDAGNECRHGECFCVTDDACEAWQICEEGECTSDPDAECSPNLECQAGYTCMEAACVCQRDYVCGEGLVCDDNQCRDATACSTDNECEGEDRICRDGSCVQPCLDADECGSPSFFFACMDGRCLDRCLGDDTECDSGQVCNEVGEDTVCVDAECATLLDCSGADLICTDADHGRCVTVEYCVDDEDCNWTERCLTPSPCPPGFDCEGGDKLCLGRTPCMDDDDCAAEGVSGYCDRGFCFDTTTCQSRDECDADFDCVGGSCVPYACRGAADCEAAEICSGGICLVPEIDATADRVEILTPGGHILQGEQKELVALAYDNTGEVIVGAEITWSSTAPDSVGVDPSNGVITGGAVAGTAVIMATYETQSTTATWQLLPALQENELRVTVVDGETGQPVPGAAVLLSAAIEDTTDASGVALFVLQSLDPVDVHVFAETHDYMSIFDSLARDVLVPLPRRSDSQRAAGVTGGVSYANVATEGDLAVGMAGTSLGGDLPDFDMARLIGDIFVSTVPMVGDVPLPGAMTAEATYMGMNFALKDTYYSLGEEGLRMGWAFAGRLDLNRLMGGGGGMNVASILSSFGLFEHGLVGRLPLAERALIQDIADIDGDGDTDEMVPDWTRFPDENHAPSQSQTLRLLVSTGDLPTLSGDRLATVVLLAGGRAPQLGLVPLGLTAAQLADGATSMEPQRMRMAPVYGGLEVGRYQVVAMAIPEMSGLEMPRQVSARVVTTGQMPEEVVFEDFLGFAESTSWSSASMTIDHTSVPRAHLLRCVVEGSDRSWHVLARDPGEGSASFQLPEVPEGFEALQEPEAARVSPMELEAPLTFDDLVHVGGVGILQLDEFTAAYSTLLQ